HLGGDRCAARGLARRGGRARAAVRASRPRHADVERLRRQRPAGARSLGDRRGALVRGRGGLGGRGARARRSAREGAVPRRLDARLWPVALPAATGPVASGAYALLSDASPSRLHLTSSWAGPSLSRPLGSGEAGVDLLPLVLHATFRVLLLAFVVAGIGFAVGTPIGAAAGLLRGRLERWVLRACDLVQAFPTFLLALAVLSAVRTPARWHIAAVFATTAWAPFARIAAAQARTLGEAQFVEAARALGATRGRTVTRHVL